MRTVKEVGLEGVIAKRRDSLYRASTRSTDWLKLKLEQSQECVIGGYHPASGSFQSILAGYYEVGKLMFAGKVRQGFNPASRAALLAKMKPLITRAAVHFVIFQPVRRVTLGKASPPMT